MDNAARAFVNGGAATFGIDPQALGKEVVLRGEEYQIIGLNTRSVKRPIKCIKLCDGGSWNWPVRTVKRALAEDAKPIHPDLLAITVDVDDLL